MPYTGKHIVSIFFAAVLAALWMSVMARADEEILTVERCVGGGTSIETFGETMVEGGVLEEGILGSEVSRSVCDGIRERTSTGTPIQRLLAAQNYAQQIELVDGAMRDATNTASHRASPPTELVSYVSEEYENEVVPTVGGEATTGEPPEDTIVEPPDDGVIEVPQHGEVPVGGEVPVEGGGSPLDSEDAEQAAGILEADGGGTIAERWKKKKDAGIAAGATPEEAEAGGRCSLDLDLLGEASQTMYRGMFAITPTIPAEMRQGDTATIELSVSGATKKVYEELERNYEEAAEVSGVETGCVGLTRRMKATLIGGSNFEIVANEGEDSAVRPVVEDTVWSWSVKASTPGTNPLNLNLFHEIKPPGGDADYSPIHPTLFDESVTIEATLRQRAAGFVGTNWQWLWTAILVPTAVYLWSKRAKGEDENEEDAE